MAKTGERYLAARRALIEQSAGRRREWGAEPEVSDDAVRAATGKGWEQWCDILDGRPDSSTEHRNIAAYLAGPLGVDPWWAQAVTGGYERITGLRLPYQRPDGTFTAGKSATVRADGERLRTMLLSDSLRHDLFPGLHTELRSKPTAKALRVSIGPGVAQFGFEPKADGRVKVTVAHERLPAFDDVEEWKFYWTEWLEAIDDDGDD